MKLHDAMVVVLRDAGREATPSEIGTWVADRDLYRRKDGRHPYGGPDQCTREQVPDPVLQERRRLGPSRVARGKGHMRKRLTAITAAVLLVAGTLTGVWAYIDGGWPETCLEMNDMVEASQFGSGAVGIYQKAFGSAAEEACRRDHLEDVRTAFGWALPGSQFDVDLKGWIQTTTLEVDGSRWWYLTRPNGSTRVSCVIVEHLVGWVGWDRRHSVS